MTRTVAESSRAYRQRKAAKLERLQRLEAALEDLAKPYPNDLWDSDKPDSIKLSIALRLIHAHQIIARQALEK